MQQGRQSGNEVDLEKPSSRPPRVAAALAAAWFVVFCSYSCFLHAAFRTTALDLALHTQILWNLAHGRFMETSFYLHSFAQHHFWPGLYLLVPVFRLFGVYGLLVTQSLVVASGAFAAYALARNATRSDAWGNAFALAYLLHPTLSIGVLFDFHLELLSIPFALFALLALDRKRYGRLALFLALAVSFYEIQAGVFFLLGVLLVFRRGQRKIGLLLALSMLAYICLLYFAIMPAFRGSVEVPHWNRFAHLGDTPLDAILTVLRHPIRSLSERLTAWKMGSLLFFFGGFAFLSFFRFRSFLPAAPLLLVLILSDAAIQADIRYGYFAPAIPFLVWSSAQGAAALARWSLVRRWLPPRRGAAILSLCALCIFAYMQIMMPIRDAPFRFRVNLAELREASRLIPDGVALSADNHLGARFGNRKILILTPWTQRPTQSVRYVFTDLNDVDFKDTRWCLIMRALLTEGEYAPVYFNNDVLLLERGATNDLLSQKALHRLTAQSQAFQRGERWPRWEGRGR